MALLRRLNPSLVNAAHRLLPTFRAAAVVRPFHATALKRITYEEWIQSKPHCHHETIQKKWYPRSANGALLTGEGDWAGGIVGLERNPDVIKDLTALCEYALEVAKTMPDSDFRKDLEERTLYKLKILGSGKTEEDMIEALDFGPLEEVMATLRGELELIKTVGKDWFSNDC